MRCGGRVQGRPPEGVLSRLTWPTSTLRCPYRAATASNVPPPPLPPGPPDAAAARDCSVGGGGGPPAPAPAPPKGWHPDRVILQRVGRAVSPAPALVSEP